MHLVKKAARNKFFGPFLPGAHESAGQLRPSSPSSSVSALPRGTSPYFRVAAWRAHQKSEARVNVAFPPIFRQLPLASAVFRGWERHTAVIHVTFTAFPALHAALTPEDAP